MSPGRAGLATWASKPASSERRTSSGCEYPLIATSRTVRGCSRRMTRGEVEAAQLRQAEVTQHDVGTVCTHAGECAHAVVRDVHLVPREPEEMGEILGRVLVVIHHQHAETTCRDLLHGLFLSKLPDTRLITSRADRL